MAIFCNCDSKDAIQEFIRNEIKQNFISIKRIDENHIRN
jgi:hypothetical protein